MASPGLANPFLLMPTPISRRTALRSIAGAAAVASLPRLQAAEAPAANAPAASAAASANAAATSFQHSVCKWCFPRTSIDDLAKAGKEVGLASIELLQPTDFAALKKNDLTCALVSQPTGRTAAGVTVGDITRAWNRLEYHDTLVEIYTKRIDETADAGFNNVICFSGNRAGMDDQQGMENCAVGLKRIMALAEKRGVTVTMELLNSRVNHRDYMCDRTPWGVELVKKIGSERFKLLYDIYHMQIMEGDVIRTIQANHQYFSHYHTAGNPGRNEFEPQDMQELNYVAISRTLKNIGYKGFLGQEFNPKRDPLTSLREAIKICTV
jgi:hydroxypyruvate isomerase